MSNSTQARPESNLVWAILCTVMCCLPLGIVAILEATKVDRLYDEGDYEGALEASAKAKKYSIWGAASIAILTVLYFIVMLVFGVSLASMGVTE